MSESSSTTLKIPRSWLIPILQLLTFGSVVGFGGVWSSSQDRQTSAVADLGDRLGRVEKALDDELNRRRAAEAAAAVANAQAQATRTMLEARIMKIEICIQEPTKCDV